MNTVCRACRFLRLQKRYWSSTGKWKRRREDRRKLPFYQLEKCCAADLLRAHSCGEKPYAALRSSAQKISRSRGRVLLPDAGNRVPDATILIHETHRELWGISAEELDARAWENTLRDLPVRTDSLMVYLKEEYGVTFPRFELGPLAEQFYLVSNRRGKLGAICMCYPGVLESLSQRFEASLYVIPSSIHECMVIPDYDVFPEECLSDMVRDVNEKTVKPQEILSDHVYYYHRESGELTLCEEET